LKLSIISETSFLIQDKNLLLFSSVAREFNALDLEIFCFCGVRLTIKTKQHEILNQTGIKILDLKLTKSIFAICIDILIINKVIRNSDILHVRGPSAALLYTVLISFLYPQKKFWFKYANAWNESKRSLLWDLQKYLLIKNRNIIVTVNGSWSNLPDHIISFENPCFYNKQLFKLGQNKKSWDTGKKVVFVGRITKEKGVFRILDSINDENVKFISEILFVGSGKDMDEFINRVNESRFKKFITVMGSINKDEVFRILSEAHLLLLPTLSPEGFPKVISEGWLNGCIPVTSDISSIPQYVKENRTGFVWRRTIETWQTTFNRSLMMDAETHSRMMDEVAKILPRFTYEFFAKRIKSEVLELFK
jgi:glycosyltransferase involved in cell wall biosynthesis